MTTLFPIKKGKDNVVADALSRREEPIQLCSISGVQAQLLEDVKNSWLQDPVLQKLITSIQTTVVTKPYYSYHAMILSRKSKMMVGSVATVRKD